MYVSSLHENLQFHVRNRVRNLVQSNPDLTKKNRYDNFPVGTLFWHYKHCVKRVTSTDQVSVKIPNGSIVSAAELPLSFSLFIQGNDLVTLSAAARPRMRLIYHQAFFFQSYP